MRSTWWPLCSSSRAIERPTLPAPAMTTRMLVVLRVSGGQCVGRCGAACRGCARRGARSVARAGQVDEVALLEDACRRWGGSPSPSRVRYAARPPVASSRSRDAPADPGRVDGHLGDDDVARRVDELGHVALGEQPAQHLVGRPPHRGDGGDAEPLVDLGAAGVVDAGDDVLDAERLAGHPGREDVGVVAAGDGGEGVGVVDAGLVAGCPGRSRPR